MGPVVQHGMCAAGVDAINAGVDLLLVSYDTDQYYQVLHCLVRARREGRLLTQRLADSDKRLAKLFDRKLGPERFTHH
jgi:beta-N-acetylhexosaminidase